MDLKMNVRGKYGIKLPHSTLEKVCKCILPDVAHRFLFGPVSNFLFSRLLIGAVFGAISGSALFLGVVHNIALNTFHKAIAGVLFVALCVLGGMLSLYFRCTVFLMFPSVLGSCGRAYMMLFVLSCLYQGPISNIQHNVQEVVLSMGCNIDQQIRHSKVMWRTVTNPFIQVLQEIVEDSVTLQKEAQNVSAQFQVIREEVVGQYGYDSLDQNLPGADQSTQEQYTVKTLMRCEYVVKKGISRCQEWFKAKWQECMDTIKSPVINHLLCVPMKFEFLCDIMRIMTPFCKEQIPVEGNFGQTYDKLSSFIDKLGEEFTTNVEFEETDQEFLFSDTVLTDEFRKGLSRSFQEKRDIVKQIVEIMQILLSFTFINVFASAYGYARQYTRDIRFDNVYITTYFRQIDERRKGKGKRYLLPLKKAEKSTFIEPWSLRIHPSELQLVTAGLVQMVSLALFVCVLLATDGVLYRILSIIQRHTLTENYFTSRHEININIAGQSMLAKLLRKTVGAFNTSSNIDLQFSNQDLASPTIFAGLTGFTVGTAFILTQGTFTAECLPKPRALSQTDYLWSTLPVLLMGLMCCFQVYTNRLRRVFTAFYFPKREKRRILFLYNIQIQRRSSFVNRQYRQLHRQRQAPKMVLTILLSPLKRLGLGVCWCWLCVEWMSQKKAICCLVPGCHALYCAQCWRDLGNLCICSLSKEQEPSDSESDTDTFYYVQ